MKKNLYGWGVLILMPLFLTGCGNKQAATSPQVSHSSKVNKKATTSSKPVKSVAKTSFDRVVDDTLKRHKYSGKMTKEDFTVSQIGNQFDVQEKETGTIVSHYIKKNGKLYYQDVTTNKLEEVK
ncbi:hypothetical protein FP435_07050 [Lactobacillus sp. PV037]|uniref:hypothetical protein n=1 Tax=unclassified Lactobacillus TaxID=2620435 RepID=UPI002240A57B|nr:MULTISPECIES: hypothetical protein [unclassified Lactobacillus]QNQ81764.1 hypothetical protein FP433_01195 [Lactobacillus sp. PV012]QNQ84191.1 hypothetical protein FP435_07050 [Lactobacillus sp. PV037]